ncbi:hypothetical protein RHMOL_Rhmol11G0142600 [Rhododendron molle]|uniref:Uncharacterized protein n=1 Tax=Rhododendron molle TaxID=49168 RepID=A0ACC0LS36_RHOML|nr:hypothetical protein RHMOL_Rhmol11G0142600 [Rhododendron molle]
MDLKEHSAALEDQSDNNVGVSLVGSIPNLPLHVTYMRFVQWVKSIKLPVKSTVKKATATKGQKLRDLLFFFFLLELERTKSHV